MINFERMAEAQKDLAYHTKQYFDILVQNGFKEEHAIMLVVAWQNSMLRG